MSAMSTHERVSRIVAHREADRVPITDSLWDATRQRWQREGLPAGADWAEYLGLDRFVTIWSDNSPRYPSRTIEETDDHLITFTDWGATIKNWKHHGGVPEFLDFTIKDRQSWQAAKARMTPTRDRINWAHLQKNYATWRQQGAWISALFWFGFDVSHSWMVGTDRVLMAMVEEPEWIVDIFNHCLDMNIALYEAIWQEGYHFDCIFWPDDMGYKDKQFFSLEMYRELLKPAQKRAADWAHAHGVKVHLHSCGNILPLIPDLLEIGVDILNPVEVKAGMDPLALKRQYGNDLTLHGGLNAVLFGDMDEMEAQMRRVIPAMKTSGGYILSSDHSVPESVSLDQFKRYVAVAKQLGQY